ncbi:MAG: di-trans,poly-cis-decaprenylcistransferase [Actinomycetia bacterium]|nr:di-trans,poly-cis-decaprenylcistransferase [Actinomycetes bacterium]
MDLSGVDLSSVPRHVAAVMDGNGRWATRQGLKRTDGHAAGAHALWDTVYGALDLGVEWLTVYAFSTENWKRSTEEVRFLMNFNQQLLIDRSQELNEQGVRIRFAGRRNWRVPKRLIRRQDESIELTKDNRKLTLTMAFNYGGRAEIIDAMKAMVADGVAPGDITEKRLRQYFYDPEMPDVDLMIRTSGEFRISNFLLWEIAYSELVFVDTLWPDFRRENLRDAIIEFQQRERRFGGVDEA